MWEVDKKTATYQVQQSCTGLETEIVASRLNGRPGIFTLSKELQGEAGLRVGAEFLN